MFDLLTRKWWAVGLRGLLAVVFGIMALVYPGITLTALVYLFGAYTLVDGMFSIATAIGGQAGNRVLFLLEGVASIAVGVIAYLFPVVTGTALVYLIGAWAIFTGMLEMMAGFSMPIKRDWLLALAGSASIVFGVIVLLNPISGALAIVGVIGVYGLVFGITLIVLAFRLLRLRNDITVQTA